MMNTVNNRRAGVLLAFAVISACKPPSHSSGSQSPPSSSADQSSATASTTPSSATPSSSDQLPAAAANVMNVTINGSMCGDAKSQYQNQPCTSITICQHGTTNCQTINNILLDTGSTGLRLFQSLVTIPVVPVMVGTDQLAECISYSGTATDWGQVAYVDVQLAGEPAVQVPIQLINAKFATPPAACSAAQSVPDSSPEEAGFNGILGVGIWNQDCGATCTTGANNGSYFACTNTSCRGTATTVQVQNPVALLPADNNGTILQFPSIPEEGATSLTGALILGIGTVTNNTLKNVTTLTTDESGLIWSLYAPSGTTAWNSFIDSGTPIDFIPASSAIPACSASSTVAPGYLCPSTTQTATITNYNATKSVSNNVSVKVANAETLLGSSNLVFDDIVMALVNDPNNGSEGSFCWGLPFFIGRTVVTGIEGTTSSLGKGPYYAY